MIYTMTNEHLVKDARLAAECLKDTNTFETGQAILLDCADRIEYLEKKLKLLEKTDMYLKTMYPEHTGFYFVCGEGGTKDDNGLPERLHVCPTYGADWMMVYTRTDKTSGPEY
jgi:hypothetical protein